MEERNLKVMTEELFEEVEQLIKDAMSKAGFGFEDIADMDDETIILMKRYFSLLKKCEEMAEVQAEQFDKISDIDRKLDRVLRYVAQKVD